ncbi:MAG: exo-alpha-sialidase [Bacteroidales bacterium]|nr:exo-alpha-sialidase [Bacteroidales bacterium]
MKKHRYIIGLILVAALAMNFDISLAQETGDVENVVTIDVLPPNSIYRMIWQPYIAKLGEDHYVAAFGLQLSGKTDMGDMLCSITKDGGKTWSPPTKIFDHRIPNGTQRYAYANAVLYKPEGHKTLWFYGMRCPLAQRNSEESDLVAAYSCDGGVSWTPVELNVSLIGPIITCAHPVAVVENGIRKYLLAGHRNTLQKDPKGDREQFVLESFDLINWELASYIPKPDEVWVHEGVMDEGDQPGEIKMVMRTAQYYSQREALPVPRAYSSVSKDNGKSWSVAVEEPALWNTASKGFFGKDSHGRHIYVYNDDKRSVRNGLYYVVKEPGKEWSKPRLFYWDNNRNSYPTLIEKEPGIFLCIWDSSNGLEKKRTAIRFGTLDLNKNF